MKEQFSMLNGKTATIEKDKGAFVVRIQGQKTARRFDYYTGALEYLQSKGFEVIFTNKIIYGGKNNGCS
jgi:hypothetical protein